MKITRCDVITALLEEPLQRNQWIVRGMHPRSMDVLNKERCKVCAVGAVLRNRVSLHMSSDAFYWLCDRQAGQHKGANRYLRNLSDYFEALTARGVPESYNEATVEDRYKMCAFAIAYLPESFEVTDEDHKM